MAVYVRPPEVRGKSRFKVVVLGEGSVGKTCLISRFVHHQFEHDYRATIGIDFFGKTVFLGDETSVRLQIWDTAGSERFKSLIPGYIRNSDFAIIAYDISNIDSFSKIETWVDIARNGDFSGNMGIILIGCKADLSETKREVSTGLAEMKAEKLGIRYFLETSAKNGQNIKTLFRTIAEALSDEQQAVVTVDDITIQPGVVQDPSEGKWCTCL